MKQIIKPNSILELGYVDVTLIKALVEQFSENVWSKENVRKENNFACFHHTQHIIFRFIEKDSDPIRSYSNPVWKACRDTLLPIMEQVTASYGYSHPSYPKVMLARLEAGHSIDPHIDRAKSNRCTHKIHIPLETNEQAIFTSNSIHHHLLEGYAYEVNNTVEHAAENLGERDRIHFIFELSMQR